MKQALGKYISKLMDFLSMSSPYVAYQRSSLVTMIKVLFDRRRRKSHCNKKAEFVRPTLKGRRAKQKVLWFLASIIEFSC